VKNPFPIDIMLREKGFKVKMSPITNQCQYKHDLLDIDFLIPHLGSADQAPSKKIPGYGIEAACLRYLDLATEFTIQVNYNGTRLTVPHPAAYTYLKYIVGALPSRSMHKARKDIDTAKRMSDFLMSDEKQMQTLNSVMERCPDPWNKKFYKSVETNNPPFLGKVQSFREEQSVTGFMVKNGIRHAYREALLLAEKSIVALHLEKHREAIYHKTIDGLQPSLFAYFVNHYLVKGKGDIAVADIVKSRRAKTRKVSKEKSTP
ncbi:MAG TPA: GSU2403 family nucleotidyltransferase fold protein, partial [bacterium]|nr:GSU2403 family nucleotidyltransferase fold protein [bacterium]